MREWGRVEFRHVVVIQDGGMTLTCLVDGRVVAVPLLYIQPGSTVCRAGDSGALVLPYWVAVELRLVDERPAA